MKYTSYLFSGLFILNTGLCLLCHSIANAVTLTDGTIAFTEQPRLISGTTPYTDAGLSDTTYYFTIEVPTNASEPLQRVSFTQTQGVEEIQFNEKDTSVWEGTRDHRLSKLGIKTTTSNDQQPTIIVTFDTPVQPGKTITIGLRIFCNPMSDGIYLFGVKAFPPGQKTHSQFLGFARLHFYMQGNFGS